MPKRNNPFGDVSSLQLKTHVGIKEVDKGVEETTRMQSVFDKTHELLFSGMKSYQNVTATEINNNNNNNNNQGYSMFGDEQEMQHQANSRNDCLKQTHIGSNCQLVVDDIEMDSACHQDEVDGNLFNPSLAVNPSDFVFGRTPGEYSPPSFVSAASLMMPNQQTYAATVTACASGNSSSLNAFERMRQAQLQKSSDLVGTSRSLARGACHSCVRPVHNRDVLKCQFCENFVCSSCTRQCSGCFMHFCQLCSILNYSQAKERAFCFNCNAG